jgi:hypothetical protein
MSFGKGDFFTNLEVFLEEANGEALSLTNGFNITLGINACGSVLST